MDKPIFHACKLEGGSEVIIKTAPFLSENNKRQWLTQGYYFWIEDIDLAHWWGSNSVKGDYAILTAKLNLDSTDLSYLDLISSPLHIKYLKKLISKYLNKMSKSCGNRYEPTISEVIDHYREKAKDIPEVFPFIGISCCDDSKTMQRKFINCGNSKDVIALNERHQICIFSGYEQLIQEKEILHPTQWCA